MSSPSPEPVAPAADWRCYRHPDRESGVRCRRCERPICPDCMISAPVGFQCPSCVKGAPKVQTLRSLRRDPYVTWTLIAVNAAVALYAEAMPAFTDEYATLAPAIERGEWWRIVTGGFMHANLFHLALNMFALLQLGTLLEPALGRARFAALYAVSLLAGSLGALLLSPNVRTVGASGAVYGLLGALAIVMRRRGVDVMQSGLGGILLVNLLFTFLVPGISIGGHLGGLAGGALAGGLLDATAGNNRPSRLAGLVACVALGLAVGACALGVAVGYAG